MKWPLTIDAINTQGLYPGSSTSSTQPSNTASPELTREWFDATNEELFRFMNELALGPQVAALGRHATLPAESLGKGSTVSVGISPAGYYVEKYGVVQEWVGNSSSSAERPWDRYSAYALFWVPENYIFPRKRLGLKIDDVFYGAFRVTSLKVRQVGIARVMVLIRDHLGEVKPVEFTLFNKELDTYSEYGDQVCVSSVIHTNSLTGLGTLPQSFWKEQTGGDKEQEGGDGIVDVRQRFSPRIQTSMLGAYPLTTEQLNEFGIDLWTESIWESFIYSLNGKPTDSIISLMWYYGLNEDIPRTERQAYLTVGNTVFNGGITSGTSIVTRPAATEYITFSAGEIELRRKFNNFLDLSPFTKVQAYIPFVGFVDLDATEVMGKIIRLDYNINIVTGAAIAYIYVNTGPNKWRVVLELPCFVGTDVPLTIDARQSIMERAVLGTAGLATGVAAPMAVPAIAQQAANWSITDKIKSKMVEGSDQSFQNTVTTFQNGISQVHNSIPGGMSRSGGLDSESASLGNFQPYILITRPEPVAPADYDQMVGTPDFRSGKVSSFNGYFRAGAIKNADTIGSKSIPRQALDEIIQMIRAGVFSD